MRIRARILTTALFNLVLVGVALALFMRLEFRAGMASILLAPGEYRLRLLSHNLVDRLRDLSPEEQDAVIDQVAREHGVEIGMFLTPRMEYVAGGVTAVPPELVAMLSRHEADPASPRPLRKGPGRKAPPVPRGQIEDGARPPGPRHPIQVFSETAPARYWFALPGPILARDEPERHGVMVIRSSNLLLTPLLFDVRPWLILLFAIGGVTFACWAPVIHRLTRSVREIHAATERLARGEFSRKVAVAGPSTEIREVGESLNRMAAQLGGFVHGQKRFLGDIAHELAAPVSRTQAAICILEERITAQPERRYVEGLRDEVEQMSGLVRELLDFSKAGLNGKEAAPRAVDVAAIAAKAIEREAVDSAKVRLAADGPVTAMADPDGLLRALGNVIRNAIRYAAQAGDIVVAVAPREGHVFVSVADQGPGLPEEALDQVFQPFFRMDDSRSRQSGGIGLGLAIVKACVKSSGGSVWCRNRPEGGLEVVIRLAAEATARPLVETPSAPATHPSSENSPAAP
ncbi:MAG: HAMP domain-containing sensor histidine kinase [Bryobacteraceae bacterium]